MNSARSRRVSLWVGWVVFAAVMISLSGIFNVITGLAAIFSDDVYVTAPDAVLVLDVTGWGWVHLLLGAGMLVAAFAVLMGRLWARVVCLGLVLLNMITQMLLLPAYPFWAVLIMVVDGLVIWALVVHGEELEGP